MMLQNAIRKSAVLVALAATLTSCGFKRHKYANPITKDTQQPDKVLFDKAVEDLEHSRFERARLELQTLMNTYDTSEYLAKAKLAVADSWFQEGGTHGFAQAEAEYKDFILFYPTMEESAEAQEKICKMQYNQMDKADRDSLHALRAEEECKQLLTQFPNSKFAPDAKKLLLNVQEVLADKEYRVGVFYHKKGSMFAAANRLQGVARQFPLYSQTDEALWALADAYQHMGDKYENLQVDAYQRIVKDYPLSAHVAEAKSRLETMKAPIPEADQVAYSRMKYEQDNRSTRGLLAKVWGPFAQHPDTTKAAKSGAPQMEGFRPTIPGSVPVIAAGAQGTSTDVTASIGGDPSAIERNPEARLSATTPAATAGGAAPTAPAQPLAPVAITRTGMDLNTATETELAKVFGKNMAKRVMAFRPYTSVGDLIKAGVTKKTIDHLKPAPAAAGSSKSTK